MNSGSTQKRGQSRLKASAKSRTSAANIADDEHVDYTELQSMTVKKSMSRVISKNTDIAKNVDHDDSGDEDIKEDSVAFIEEEQEQYRSNKSIKNLFEKENTVDYKRLDTVDKKMLNSKGFASIIDNNLFSSQKKGYDVINMDTEEDKDGDHIKEFGDD